MIDVHNICDQPPAALLHTVEASAADNKRRLSVPRVDLEIPEPGCDSEAPMLAGGVNATTNDRVSSSLTSLAKSLTSWVQDVVWAPTAEHRSVAAGAALAAQARFCAFCGQRRVRSGALFCAYCGKAL